MFQVPARGLEPSILLSTPQALTCALLGLLFPLLLKCTPST